MRFRLLFGIALERVLEISNRLVFKVKHILFIAKPGCFLVPFLYQRFVPNSDQVAGLFCLPGGYWQVDFKFKL